MESNKLLKAPEAFATKILSINSSGLWLSINSEILCQAEANETW